MSVRIIQYLALFMCLSVLLPAQNTELRNGNLPNGNWGLGYSVLDEVLPEGDEYNPYTLLGNYTIWQRKRFLIYAESQFTQMSSPIRERTNYEFGGNLGFTYLFINNPRLRMNASIGSGPHFITINTGKQARGFIFSDNFEIGSSYNLFKLNFTIVLKVRYRHISNAGLNEPNGGIDNLFVVAGVGTTF